MKIAIVGHKKFAKSKELKAKKEFSDKLTRYLHKYNKATLLIAVQPGVATWSINYALRHNIKYNLYLPFSKKELVEKGYVTKKQLKIYLKYANKVIKVNKKSNRSKLYDAIVEHAGDCIGYYNRVDSSSGNLIRKYINKCCKIPDNLYTNNKCRLI